MLTGLSRLVSAIAIAALLWVQALAFEVVPPIQEQDRELEARNPVACTEAMERSETLNGLELFRASKSCFREAKRLEETFLLVVGQIRAMTDVSVLLPLGDADKTAVVELYGLMFSQSAGAGYDELYRDQASTDELFSRLNRWTPLISDAYDPGWNYKRHAKSGPYARAANNQKAQRIEQLQHYAALIRRDDYYAASKELDELQRRNPEGFGAKSHDADRAAELMKLMRQIDQDTQTPMSERE